MSIRKDKRGRSCDLVTIARGKVQLQQLVRGSETCARHPRKSSAACVGTLRELQALLAVLSPERGLLVAMALYTGVRRGEPCGSGPHEPQPNR